MAFTLPELPFDRESLAPHMSAEDRAALRIDLRNGRSAIAGRVTDDLGQPVAGADVSLVTGGYSHTGQWTPVWGPRAQTDAVGRYVLDDVPPGDYRLLAVADARSGVATLNLAPRREESGIDVRLEPIPEPQTIHLLAAVLIGITWIVAVPSLPRVRW